MTQSFYVCDYCNDREHIDAMGASSGVFMCQYCYDNRKQEAVEGV